jgi:hypothetical protein
VGGYWEDLDVEPGEVIERTLLLAPGPDMVRLPGGDFVMGMRTEMLEEIERAKKRREMTLDPVPQRKVRMLPFEIDRHPVTAAQFKACWDAGGCKWDGEQVLESSRNPFDYCAHEPPVGVASWEWPRSPRPRMADYPVNCVARWEAEKYCAWAGKRLATADEWEYAARSAREDWDCPSSPLAHQAGCSLFVVSGYGTAHETLRAREVCAHRDGISRQGVCDFGQLDESVLDDGSPAYSPCNSYGGPVRTLADGGWQRPLCEDDGRRSPVSTFRCARGAEGREM